MKLLNELIKLSAHFVDFEQFNFAILSQVKPDVQATLTLLTDCLSIQFFDSPEPLTQSVRLPMVTQPSLCSPYVTYRTSYHAIGHQVLPTHSSQHEFYGFKRAFFTLRGFFTLHSLYPGKWRISLGMIDILSICLHSHT